jgi:hypothetical protein
MKADLLAADVTVRLTKIRLRMPRAMAERNKHLARPQLRRRDIFPDDRVAAGKPFFVPQPFEDPLRRVPLLGVNKSVRCFLESGPRLMLFFWRISLGRMSRLAMKRKRFSVEQIVTVLKQAELGLRVADLVHPPRFERVVSIVSRNCRKDRFVVRRDLAAVVELEIALQVILVTLLA